MMKKAISLILALVLCMGLAACAPAGKNEDTKAETEDTKAKTVESFIERFQPPMTLEQALEEYGQPDYIVGSEEEDFDPNEPISIGQFMYSTYNVSCGTVETRLHFTSRTEELDSIHFEYVQEGEGEYTDEEIQEAAAAFEVIYAHLVSLYGEPTGHVPADMENGLQEVYHFETGIRDMTIGLSNYVPLGKEKAPDREYWGLIYCICAVPNK